MEAVSTNSYSPPVDQLLTYGEAKLVAPEEWPNYVELGLGPEHIPDLIRMATDKELNEAESDSLEVWAPTHAWRTLGQLRAEAAIEPLLALFETFSDDDWAMQELPIVIGMIGPAALSALAAYLAERSHDESAHISATVCVQEIGTRWIEARTECVALLTRHLELFAENESGLNGFLIEALVKLEAREAAPVMERAFAARRVDFIMGDWEDVQVELGLKSREEVEESRSNELSEAHLPDNSTLTSNQASPKTHSSSKGGAAQKKAKSKMAKQSRKKNRRR